MCYNQAEKHPSLSEFARSDRDGQGKQQPKERQKIEKAKARKEETAGEKVTSSHS
jgi:hypothetical protein